MSKPIPQRAPLGDTFEGVVLQVEAAQLLAPQAIEGAQVVLGGILTIRYGLRYLGKPHLSIVPGLVALDYGDMLVGEEAWEFITKRSNLYPRAEVFGYRNDGHDEMAYIKVLDLVLPVEVLVYPDPTTVKPTARPNAVIAPDGFDLPPRLLHYLPRYASLEAWRTQGANS